ncbi:hypothetical protein ACFSL4_06430 [Streptomyces caeni]|uniref:Uncharacterized protein n=1 Tax=Streptomyces caeni TaxID=2307231 RepID=A0ABW4IN23_9ACTN
MGGKEHVCPSCGQPVGTVVRRHKTLGAFVPVWRPGPCRDPRCPGYREQARAEAPRNDREREHSTTSGTASNATSDGPSHAEVRREEP